MAPIGTINVVLQKETISTNLGHWNDTSSAVVNSATTSAHGTGGVVTNRLRAVAAATAQAIPAWGTAPAGEGWRVDVADMGAGSQRRQIPSGAFPNGNWTLRLRLTASVAQVSADTTVTVRVFAGVPGSMTERFRRSQAYAIGATATNVVQVCGSDSTIGDGVTGSPSQIDLAANETMQMEIYLAAPGVAILGQTLTLSLEAAAPTTASTSRLVLPAAPIILETLDNSSSSSVAALDALSETRDVTSTSSHSESDALAETPDLVSVGIPTTDEALLETLSLASIAQTTQSEAIADPPKDITSVATLSEFDALAEIQSLTSQTVLESLEALAEITSIVTVAVFTKNWQRVSPGLSGVAYDSTGSTPIVGAQVLVFRDDTNAVVATLTSDALGQWATDLDPAFDYWVSYWKDGATQIEDETDRHIAPVETVVEVGT